MKAPEIAMREFVTGEKFELLCDVDTEKDKRWEASIDMLRKPVITVFSQTHELKNRVPIIASRWPDRRFVIVSHNSDGAVERRCSGRWFDYQWEPVHNIVHWFCQNTDVVDPSVTPIPIAMENTYVFKPEVKQGLMVRLRDQNIPKDNKMFMCFNVGTNREDRGEAVRMFSNLPWSTWKVGENNISLVNDYFEQMVRHRFVMSPDGNGIDTIRTWEALYLGCIPIVKRHVFTEYFAKHLPMIVVGSYAEISLPMLLAKAKEFEKRTFDYDMLTMSYWKGEISDVVRSAAGMEPLPRKRRIVPQPVPELPEPEVAVEPPAVAEPPVEQQPIDEAVASPNGRPRRTRRRLWANRLQQNGDI